MPLQNNAQKILVFQQHGSGEAKIQGIRRFGDDRFHIDTVSIDIPLPGVIDDGRIYLPADIHADLVLDFLRHPDLSQDLADLCCEKRVALIASGKKIRNKGVFTPPT